MRRICCFVERWESGGIESFLYNVLTRIDLTQLQVDIVASSLGTSIFTEPLKKIGICFFELSGSQQKVLENHRRFHVLLRDRRYDVLHLNAFQGLSLSYLQIAEQEGVSVRIAHSHNAGLRKSLTRPLKLAVHAFAKERYSQDATDLWACSHSAAEFLFPAKALEQDSFQFIPNGIDTERFRFDPTVRNAVRAELGLEGRFVIGNVGRLCFQKNQDFLLDIFVETLKQNPDSRLLLIGEGENKLGLMKKVHRLRIDDKVLFYGTTNHVEQLLWAMDLFAFPSQFEGLGIAAVEAQAAGLPVFCSEYIPAEVHITPLVSMIPLSVGAGGWAKQLLAFHKRRPDCIEAVQFAGFDIAQTAKQIEAFYRRVHNIRGTPCLRQYI